ncbi:uncharacterized protein ARMOST_21572 [Armillaria ostoyae]|uniref:Uncharacterized protein n=1 Tax=Armillaria ostoyae TaxID=47428 RepID=A0A284SAH9_ARMOS|nr:uncharacterized protein ARMOST_21572 [Armillaria ostoyae]
MSAPSSNRSCDPFLTHLGCSVEDYVEYTVNVSNPAKMQTGVTIAQMYEEASPRGYTIVDGDCPAWPVGSSKVEVLVDYRLSTEYLPTMHFRTRLSRQQAVLSTPLERKTQICSGHLAVGLGTDAIVWSVTVKVQPDMSISGASVSFSVGGNVTLDMWWADVNAYRAMTAGLIDKGGYSLAVHTQGTFQLSPMLLPNSTLGDIAALLNPFLANL